jgi:hypothetical protein
VLVPSLSYILVSLLGVAIVAAILVFNRYNSHERSYRRRMRRENSDYRKLMADRNGTGESAEGSPADA